MGEDPGDRGSTRHTESRAGRPDAGQGDEQGGVVHQEGLRDRPAALETDLLAGVDSLRLTDRAKRPPQRRAALHRDLEPGRGNADRGAPAHGGLPVEIVRGEDRRHGYAMPTSIPRNVESASPVAASLWGACTTPARSSAPASLTVSQANRAFRTSTHGQPRPSVTMSSSALPPTKFRSMRPVTVERDRAPSKVVCSQK